MDWLVKSLGLPQKFLCSNQEPFGGGVLQVICEYLQVSHLLINNSIN